LIAAGQKYHIPPHILFGIAYRESGWQQFRTSDRVTKYNCEPDGRVGVGIMQITVLPSVDDYEKLCTDIDYNIDRGAAMLIDKWNATPIIGDGVGANGHDKLENWYYAVWGYNGLPVNGNQMNNPNANPSAYQELVYDIIANCPNNQWTSCTITKPSFTEIGTGYPKAIATTPTPTHVDANYDGVIDGGETADPFNIYLNVAFGGPFVGTDVHPFANVIDAIGALASGGTLHVSPGTYILTGTDTFSKPMTITVNGTGSVTLGR
jgi:hypothetical protein